MSSLRNSKFFFTGNLLLFLLFRSFHWYFLEYTWSILIDSQKLQIVINIDLNKRTFFALPCNSSSSLDIISRGINKISNYRMKSTKLNGFFIQELKISTSNKAISQKCNSLLIRTNFNSLISFKFAVLFCDIGCKFLILIEHFTVIKL